MVNRRWFIGGWIKAFKLAWDSVISWGKGGGEAGETNRGETLN